MKKLLRFAVLAAFALCLTTACSKDNDESTPELSVTPNTALSFSAAGTESHNITVNTNQNNWDAVSDNQWCVVSKTSGKFTVTTSANASQVKLSAIITVTAGKAESVKISVTQSAFGAELSITPATPVEFSATGIETFTINVTTNQGEWDVKSTKPWCIVTKRDGKFTITATQNLTEEALSAEIIVSAGNAANVSLAVTQKAGKPTEVSSVIWEDAHWRLFALKGKPKKVVIDQRGYYKTTIEFNSAGRITSDVSKDKTWSQTFTYDGQNRIIKSTIQSGSGLSKSSTYEYTYGDHTKYIFTEDINEILYMAKGLTSIKQTDKDGIILTHNFIIENNRIYTEIENHSSVDITYSGDFPTVVATRLKKEEPSTSRKSLMVRSSSSENAEWKTYKRTYKYGNDYKYADIITDFGDGISTHSYSTGNTTFLVLTKEKWEYSDSHNMQAIEYNANWDEAKETSTNTYDDTKNERFYTDYKLDTSGNWIERTVKSKDSADLIEKRTITYY